jgi:hypothetical protein
MPPSLPPTTPSLLSPAVAGAGAGVAGAGVGPFSGVEGLAGAGLPDWAGGAEACKVGGSQVHNQIKGTQFGSAHAQTCVIHW